jgi:serine O-acetyltransferase
MFRTKQCRTAQDSHNFHGHIFQEVYGGKKIGWMRKLYLRYLLPSTNAVYLIRKMQFARIKLHKKLLQIVLIRRYGINVGMACKISIGLRLPHPYSITIGEYVEIGENATIFQNTTVGARLLPPGYIDWPRGMYPTIGSNVYICANAVVIGGIKLADNSIIGAGSVLLTDTKEGGTYSGVPARIIIKEKR